MAGAAIELTDVEKRYGALAALAGVSLSVARGEFTALVGGSGSGKTTLLKTINRLVNPDAGSVRVLGDDVAAAPPKARRTARRPRCRPAGGRRDGPRPGRRRS